MSNPVNRTVERLTGRTAAPTTPDDRLAQAISRTLDHSSSALPGRVTLRLAQIRVQALMHQQQWQHALRLAGHGTHRALGHLGDHFHDAFGSATDWRRWAAAISVLLFAAFFMFWQANNQAEDLASEDSALLSETLPPSALIDKGFLSWVSSGTPDHQE